MVFIASMAMLTGVGFGVLPALQASGSAPLDALKGAGRGVTGGGGWMRRAIVVTEIALVCVLLTGAGLLTRSLSRVFDVDPGFTSEHVISLRVDPSRLDHPTLETRNAYFDAVLQHVRSVPGVEAVGLTDALPLGDNFGWRGWTVSAKDRVTDPGARANPLSRMIDDGYFSAMRIAMQAGRGFTSDDHPSSERVVVINEALARALWPAEDPWVACSARPAGTIAWSAWSTTFAISRSNGTPARKCTCSSDRPATIRPSISSSGARFLQPA
jgi:hypothetical protein